MNTNVAMPQEIKKAIESEAKHHNEITGRTIEFIQDTQEKVQSGYHHYERITDANNKAIYGLLYRYEINNDVATTRFTYIKCELKVEFHPKQFKKAERVLPAVIEEYLARQYDPIFSIKQKIQNPVFFAYKSRESFDNNFWIKDIELTDEKTGKKYLLWQRQYSPFTAESTHYEITIAFKEV